MKLSIAEKPNRGIFLGKKIKTSSHVEHAVKQSTRKFTIKSQTVKRLLRVIS